MDLAQYRELAAFAQFASDLDEATQAQISRGKRVTELMKQAQYHPLSVADMAISLFAANEGFIDDVEVNKVGDFEDALLSHVNSQNADLMKEINDKGDFNDDIKAQMKSAIENFKTNGSW